MIEVQQAAEPLPAPHSTGLIRRFRSRCLPSRSSSAAFSARWYSITRACCSPTTSRSMPPGTAGQGRQLLRHRCLRRAPRSALLRAVITSVKSILPKPPSLGNAQRFSRSSFGTRRGHIYGDDDRGSRREEFGRCARARGRKLDAERVHRRSRCRQGLSQQGGASGAAHFERTFPSPGAGGSVWAARRLSAMWSTAIGAESEATAVRV